MNFPTVLRIPRLLTLVTSASFFMITACAGGGGAEYPIVMSDLLVDDGRVVYEANCVTCHGDANTSPPFALAPPHTVEGHTWEHSDRPLVDLVLNGATMAQTMPTFRDTLSEDEVRAAIAYIKSFWPAELIEQQIEKSAEYEKQFER